MIPDGYFFIDLAPLECGSTSYYAFVGRNLKLPAIALVTIADRQGLTITGFVQEVDVDAYGTIRFVQLDREAVEHQIEITQRIRMAVEVDVAIRYAVLHTAFGLNRL